MNSIGTTMKENILQLKGKPAHHITSFLKNIGGDEGKMADGLLCIVDVLNIEKEQCVLQAKTRYGIGGIVIGVAGSAIAASVIYLYEKNKEKEKNRKKMNNIINVLQQEVELSKRNSISSAEESIKKDEFSTENDTDKP